MYSVTIMRIVIASILYFSMQELAIADNQDTIDSKERTFKTDFKSQYQDEVYRYTLEDEKNEEKMPKMGSPSFVLSSSLMQTIVLILFIFALGFTIFLYFQGQGNWRIFQKEKLVSTEQFIESEEAFMSNHDVRIKDAEKNQDYTSATRYRFLKYLSTLDKKNIIRFHKEKTNHEYVKEINSITAKKKFQQLVYIYDNVWYGKHSLDGDMYQKVAVIFDRAQNDITP
ncbi:MAG: DUF4129 domain-containing protein [Saprospiraceae bacterium]